MLKAFLAILIFTMALAAQAMPERCQDIFREPIEIAFPQGTVVVDSAAAYEAFDDANEIAIALKLKSKAAREEAMKRFFTPAPTARWESSLVFANYAMSMVIGAEIGWRFWNGPHDLHTAVTTAIVIPSAMFISDFMSGLFHKFFDDWAPRGQSVIGRAGWSFRAHHDVPTDMNRFTYMQLMAPYSKLMAPLYAATAIAGPHMSPEATTGILLSLVLFTNGNEFHTQAHRGGQASRWAKITQAMRLTLRLDNHGKHHKAKDIDYGIINGWSNYPTRKLWKLLDHAYYRALKRLPENWIENPSKIPPYVIRDLEQDLDSIPQELFVHLANNPDSRMDDIVRLYIERQLEEDDQP